MALFSFISLARKMVASTSAMASCALGCRKPFAGARRSSLKVVCPVRPPGDFEVTGFELMYRQRQAHDIETAVSVGVRKIGRQQRLVEGLPKQVLVELQAVEAGKDRGRPCRELLMDCGRHVEVGWERRVRQLVQRDARDDQRAGCREDVRLDATADLEAIDLIQRIVGPDRRKLQDLVVEGVAARCFGVVEYERHAYPAVAIPIRQVITKAAVCSSLYSLSQKAKKSPAPRMLTRPTSAGCFA